MKTDPNFILMSIKPCFVRKIYSGRKTIEYRKVQPKQNLPILIYETAPVKKITGVVSWWDLGAAADPETVWKITSAHGGISKQDFDNYYAGSKLAVALRFHGVKKLASPIPLTDLNTRAPQSYQFISLPANLISQLPSLEEE